MPAVQIIEHELVAERTPVALLVARDRDRTLIRPTRVNQDQQTLVHSLQSEAIARAGSPSPWGLSIGVVVRVRGEIVPCPVSPASRRGPWTRPANACFHGGTDEGGSNGDQLR